jgi:hypothetical protein
MAWNLWNGDQNKPFLLFLRCLVTETNSLIRTISVVRTSSSQMQEWAFFLHQILERKLATSHVTTMLAVGTSHAAFSCALSSFYTCSVGSFNHEWMSSFAKCSLCDYCDDYIFSFILLICFNTVIDLHMWNQSCFLAVTHGVCPCKCDFELSLVIFIEDFCTYVY